MESMEMQKRIYSVAQINYYLKEMLREDDFLNGLWIKGEISGYKEHSSGHIYFSLKDGQNSLRCVIFRSYTGNIQFAPQSGMEVLAYGTVSLYERDGNCQLYVEEMIPAGAGAYFLALENLKKALREEGLFSEQRKKPLPYFCHVLGVVTSQEGAAWADIQRVAYSRFPAVEIRLFPTLVQGEKAPQ
ncbi:MAG: exodeoxyribonuclease VII large subunit, partial [Clostridiales bacterium]